MCVAATSVRRAYIEGVVAPCSAAQRRGPLPLATYAAVADRDLLTEAALSRMLAGLSARR